jgi:hypothetical protein
MNHGKYVFSQLVEFLPQRFFDSFVTKYNDNMKVRHFTYWNKLLCMIFGQLSSRDKRFDNCYRSTLIKIVSFRFWKKCNTKQFIKGK